MLNKSCRSKQSRGLRRLSASACLLRSRVRIPPGARMFVCCKCCVLSGTGLCDQLITRAGDSYRLCCVVCDLETSWLRRLWPTGGCRAQNKQTNKSLRKMWDIWLSRCWQMPAHQWILSYSCMLTESQVASEIFGRPNYATMPALHRTPLYSCMSAKCYVASETF
jgi:hypothetical protein